MASAPRDPTRVRRRPERAAYDADAIVAVLDAGFLCHVGVVRDGRPVVVPTLYGRDSDRLLLHGSPVAGMFRDLGRTPTVSVTVTHVDGLVLARSAFHHSLNYRSVVIHGEAVELVEPDEKVRALRLFMDHVTPGRWDAVREPTAGELKQTSVWAVPFDRASAKVRSGPPVDDAEDYALPIWAGVLPLGLTAGMPVPDDRVPPEVAVPAHVSSWPDVAPG
jgi:nitroimidazol reductase NimA-like FMN-containing flavoprotein (pyridoxamine 5'-phosphate oxidase superfamily)